jgi:hypothetical protein
MLRALHTAITWYPGVLVTALPKDNKCQGRFNPLHKMAEYLQTIRTSAHILQTISRLLKMPNAMKILYK